MGGKRIRGLKARVGREYCISREGARWASLSRETYKMEEFEGEVTVLVGVESAEAGMSQGGKLQK